jgi:hypothetical protein
MAESNEGALAKSAEAVPPVPPLKLIPAAYAFLLTLGWVAIASYVFPRNPLPREQDGPLPWIAGTLLVVYPLVWIGFSAWRNREGFRAWNWLRRVLRGARVVLQPAYWLLGILIAISLAMSGYSDYGVRAKMSEVILSAFGFRSSITEHVQANKTLVGSGAGLVVRPVGMVTAGLVGRDGVVIVYNDEFRVLVALVPEMEGGDIKWTCDAMPAKFFPPTCRDVQWESTYAQRNRGLPREDALELLKRGAAWQRKIANTAELHGTLANSTKTMVVRREGLLDFGLIDTNGRIALYSDRHGTFALLEPELKDAQVTWRCRVWPATAAPPGCAPAP